MSSHLAVDGSAFHPDYLDGRAGGELELSEIALWFRPRREELEQIQLPVVGLKIRLGGASDRLLFFEHDSVPGLSIFTDDHSILGHPLFAEGGALEEQAAGVRGKKRWARAATLGILASIFVALGALWAAKDPIIELAVAKVPPEAEVKLGQIAWGQMLVSIPLIHDEELDAQLEALAAPLLDVVPDTGYAFDLHLANDADLNAFALPGGHIVVNSGLIQAAGSAEEVLGVLAHEISHVTERHTLQQLASTLGLYAVVQFFLGDVSGLAAVLADQGLHLATLQFSRDHETDADEVGWAILVQAQVDPRGMVLFFKRLEQQQEEQLGELAGLERSLSFLSTHPASAERIANLQERANGLGEALFQPSAELQLRLEKLRGTMQSKIAEQETAGAEKNTAAPATEAG